MRTFSRILAALGSASILVFLAGCPDQGSGARKAGAESQVNESTEAPDAGVEETQEAP